MQSHLKPHFEMREIVTSSSSVNQPAEADAEDIDIEGWKKVCRSNDERKRNVPTRVTF